MILDPFRNVYWKGSLERHKCSWNDNIKLVIKELESVVLLSIKLPDKRGLISVLLNKIMNHAVL